MHSAHEKEVKAFPGEESQNEIAWEITYLKPVSSYDMVKNFCIVSACATY